MLAKTSADRPLRTWPGPLAVALVATVAAIATLRDPGLTCDEYYDVQAGKSLVFAWRHQAFDFFRLQNVDQTFGQLTLHPPLGRWLLGWTHHVFDLRPDEPFVVSVLAGRFAPALAYGVLVLLVGLVSARVSGPLGGTVASVAVAISPRVFAHAHFATLDMLTALAQFCSIAALVIAIQRGGHWWRFALAGLIWGLALATKLPALLFAPPVALWCLWHVRRHALMPLVCWSVAGVATFLLLWPWLWHDTLPRLREYLSTATNRQALHVFYLGRAWNDVDAPWHYPCVMFVATLPLPLLLLGLGGCFGGGKRWWRDPALSLVAATFLFELGVFSWPGTPVYDGVRLFLIAYALWAVAVGVGADWLFRHARLARWPRGARLMGLAALLASPLVGLLAVHPYELSYYSVLVGGLPGAKKLGFETTYWGDSVSQELLEAAVRTAPGERILFAPHLAPFQAAAISVSNPALSETGTTLVGWDANRPDETADCRYAIVYRRRADWERVEPLLAGARVVAETSKQGVWLARLYELHSTEMRPENLANNAPR